MTPFQVKQLAALGWTTPHFQFAVRDEPNRASTRNSKLATAAIVRTSEGEEVAFQRLYRYALAVSERAGQVPK